MEPRPPERMYETWPRDRGDGRIAYRPQEVAAMFGLTRDQVLHRLRTGQMRGHKTGRYWFVPKVEVERLVTEDTP